jgi:hypothetical protein
MQAEILITCQNIASRVKFCLAITALLLLSPITDAHVPLFPEGNLNLSFAAFISDAAKSWAAYDFLSPYQPKYYCFDMDRGQRISLSLLTSTNPKEKRFMPSMALLGPGIGGGGEVPGYVEIPVGYGHIVAKGSHPEDAVYEPFGPGSYYQLTDLDLDAPDTGRYYVAVYNNNYANNNSNSGSSDISRGGSAGGHYALAIGYVEEFTLLERILTPIELISVYQWEGQSLSTVLAPMLAAALLGLLVIWRGRRRTPFSSAGTLAGFLILGTSATVLSQTVFSLIRAPGGAEVEISLLLAVIPAVLGIAALRLSRGEAGILQRISLAVIGTIALLAGSGLIAGPLLAIASSVLPSGLKVGRERPSSPI